MSKRRGKILTDAESVERRNWYSDLQKVKIEEIAKEKAYYEDERKKALHQTNYVESLQKEASLKLNISPWIVALNDVKYSTATVLCFHGFGQNQGVFKRWHKPLSDAGIQLCGVCLPGRSNRAAESCFTSIRDGSIAVFLAMKAMNMLTLKPSAHAFDEKLESEITTRPLILFGHDVGCLVAYEVAKLLQDYHYNHTALIVSSCPSPYQQGQNRFGKKMCFLSDAELLKHMIELGGVPEAMLKRGDMLKYFIPLFRSDYYLYDKYVITPPANVLTIAESEIEFATDALRVAKEVSLKYPDEKNKPKTKYGQASSVHETDEEEETVYPVVLYRLHCEIVSIRVEDDPFVSESELAEWAHMSNSYDQITLDSVGPGGHVRALCEHDSIVLDLLKRYCGVD